MAKKPKPDVSLLNVFSSYALAFVLPTFVACFVATTSFSVLWCFVLSPVLATVSYFYDRSRS